MAAKHLYGQTLFILLFNLTLSSALERRFSDFKRCADQECSMLLCRGKATRDFTGPDCRFLSFKKSETIYVYYKLSGRRTDIWAGSLGNNFGYFPKELLAINHLYTDKELEVPTEETDFVCFDTGYSTFDNYDIDKLISFSLDVNTSENNETLEVVQNSEITHEESPPSDELTERDKQTESNTLEPDIVPDSTLTSSLDNDGSTHLPFMKEETTTESVPFAREEEIAKPNFTLEHGEGNVPLESSNIDVTTISEEEYIPQDDSVNEPVFVSETVQIPELQTTLGTTFDVVTSDDEITTKVTPHVEEDTPDGEEQPEEVVEDERDIPLLSYTEETMESATPDDPTHLESSPTVQEDEAKTTGEKNVWTSLGDAVFSAVTGVETNSQDVSSEEDDDDEEDEDEIIDAPVTTHVYEAPAKEEETLLFPESEKGSQHLAEAPKDLPDPEVEQPDLVDTDSHSNVLSVEKKIVDIPPEPVTEHHLHQVKPDGSDTKAQEPPEAKEEELSKHSQLGEEELDPQDVGDDDNEQIALDSLDENETEFGEEVPDTKTEENPDHPLQESQYNYLDLKDPNNVTESVDDPPETGEVQSDDSESPKEEDGGVYEEAHPEATEAENNSESEGDKAEKQELLEDENALLMSESEGGHSDDSPHEAKEEEEEEHFSESVMRLSFLRDHFAEEDMTRLQRLVGLRNLFKVESMFLDLDTELQATRASHAGSTEDIEVALENILEASENTILDEIERMMDSRGKDQAYGDNVDQSVLDEETKLLDDFQELAFSLRQKYSTVSDSVPLAVETSDDQRDLSPSTQEYVTTIMNVDKKDESQPDNEAVTLHVDDKIIDSTPATDQDDNVTEIYHEVVPEGLEREQVFVEDSTSGIDVNVEDDGGHFNKNKDDTPSYSAAGDMQKAPHDTLEDGFIESHKPTTEVKEDKEEGSFTFGIPFVGCFVSMLRTKIAEWTPVVISLLPEEWRPGETFYGCPWEVVVVTALVGVLTFAVFFWSTILAVKKKEYLVDEKKLREQIEALKKEKSDALGKITELQKQAEELKENHKQSKETAGTTVKRVKNLESKVVEAEKRNEKIAEERNNYAKLLEEERATSLQNESRIEKLEKANEKLQLSRKKIQEALTKTTVLLDEVKIREDARNAQHKCVQKEFAALKEENKTLKTSIKSWEDKHKELNEKIKVYQKSQKELEDSVVLKDHNVEVLSQLLADIDACDSHKGEINMLVNGEVAADKKTVIKNRIKQMMDVSRVQTTLTVIEEERDRFMAKLLNEEKSRKELEEKHQELEHAIGSLKSDKSHVENQLKILQQKNEIMVEMYQQKENALQQRLTKEELERRSKESQLTEVGGKALEAEEQVKVLRQRISEMEEQMKKTEQVYKEQIKEQENKTHSNWVNARNAERALSQEKIESSKLKEKLAVLTSQLNERRAPLFRPNSGQAAGPRQGDSYGPSPVSGGAPSPPIMIEGPRRPPSAPVGRRIDPYGPRPPSDPHGRFPENKPAPGMDMVGPRSSSPANLDTSTGAVEAQVESESGAVASTESPELGPGSFMASPIRDSPGPPPGPALHDPHLPPPLSRFPPPGPYRPPRPGPYGLPPGVLPPHHHGLPPPPANGLPPGRPGPDFGPHPANGHAFPPRLGPGPDPRGPPLPHFRPPPLHPFGPMPPRPGVRGPMGPRPPIPPDMRFGPRDHFNPPMDVPPHLSETYAQRAPNAPQNSAAAQGGPSGGAEAPQDSTRPAMVQP